jgi:broad specificity phosphatase PhoE
VSRIYLVRHGEAAAGWGAHHDPGLSDRGHRQAEAVAQALEPLGPLAIVSSPLMRAQETAAPLAGKWGAEVRVDPGVGEIPSPTDDLAERAAWLTEQFRLTWAERGDDLHEWRATVLATLLAMPADTVVFTHYVAIGVAVAAATGDPEADVRPDNCSVTILESSGDRDGGAETLQLIELPRQRSTFVG